MASQDVDVKHTQKDLLDEKKSKREKYQELILGKKSLWFMIKYELIVTLVSWIPGALGLLLRSKLYPKILGSVGKNVSFGVNITFRHPRKVFIGDNVVIDDYCVLDAKGSTNAGIKIGNGVFIGRNTIFSCHNGDIILEDNVNMGVNCLVTSMNSVLIKKNNLIAGYVYIVGADHIAERTDVPVLFQGRRAKGVVLEENIWLGAKVVVLDGAHIGRDAIIGAGSIVGGEIPEYAIAVGTPARVLRDRRETSPKTSEKESS